MSKLMIITDSNSGISQEEAKNLGIYVLPMPFTIDDEEYLEEITISQEQFYKFLQKDADVKTSQPSQYTVEELWDETLKEYDEIVYIPMSSGLSGTCSNAIRYSEQYGGRVQVVDNQRISVTLKESVFEAIAMAKQGKSAKEIKEYLESTKNKASIYIMLATLKYLKRGGRISSTAAAISAMLNIKPVLTSRGGNFERFALVMSNVQGKKKMIQKIKAELESEFREEYDQGKMCISVAHTNNEAEALKFKEEILKELPNVKFHFVDPLSLSVSCHIGPGSIAIAMAVNNYNEE